MHWLGRCACLPSGSRRAGWPAPSRRGGPGRRSPRRSASAARPRTRNTPSESERGSTFSRFTKDAKAIVVTAEEEARSLGSAAIEAEHLLLAYAASTPAPAAIDRETLIDALEADFESSLRAAGVAEKTIAAAPPPYRSRKPGFGASSKAALESAFRIAGEGGERRIEARHVALGTLAAKRGTLPRALRAAGLEPGELRQRL